MLSVNGGRSANIVGCRANEGVCYFDLVYHDSQPNEIGVIPVDCDVAHPMHYCGMCQYLGKWHTPFF